MRPSPAPPSSAEARQGPDPPRHLVHLRPFGNDRFGIERDFETRLTELLVRERAMGEQHLQMLAQNTELTERIAGLTNELHATICAGPTPAP